MVKFRDLITHLIEPWAFMFLSLLQLPPTIITLLLSLQLQTLLSPSRLQSAWFGRFWAKYGPSVRDTASHNATPLFAHAHGVVLEVGPGNGEWVQLYDKQKVERVYGVEPNEAHHGKLRERVITAGLGDVYVIVGRGVEDLDSGAGSDKVEKGSVDCVLTIQCLCSIPRPKEMISDIYSYLKPGGQWIVYEHVVTYKNPWISTYQRIIDFIWPTFLGGCSITRDTEKWLREAGKWTKIDLKQPEGEPDYQVIPHVMGILQK